MAQANTAEKVTYQQTTIRDDNQFGRALRDAKAGVTDAFQLIQDCILYGLEKYQKHSADASYLSRAMDLCEQLQGTNPNAVKGYIQEHANVVYRQAPDGTKKFGKDGKGPASVAMPEEGYYWYEHESTRIVVRPDYTDPIAALQRLFKKLDKLEKDGKIEPSRLEVLHELEAQLQPFMELEALPKEKLFLVKEGESESESE